MEPAPRGSHSGPAAVSPHRRPSHRETRTLSIRIPKERPHDGSPSPTAESCKQALELSALWTVKEHLNWTHVLKGPNPHAGTHTHTCGFVGRAGEGTDAQQRTRGCVWARPALCHEETRHAGADLPDSSLWAAPPMLAQGVLALSLE